MIPYQFVIGLARGRPSVFLRERLGLVDCPPQVAGRAIWMHAVSVGEVRLALLLVAALRDRFPGLAVALTTGTATGRAIAHAAGLAGPSVELLAALPIDLPGPMRRFLARVRPRAAIVLETEIWPVMLRQCGRARIPIAIVNGRISPRAFRRYRTLRRFLAPALREVALFAMQSPDDAARIVALGAPPDRVAVLGNLKFDLPAPEATGEAVRRRLSLPDTPIFVAGSTDAGEEAPVIEAFRILRAAHPGARLLIAPRHPERFAAAGAILREAGLRRITWSGGAGPAPAGASVAGGTAVAGDPPWDALLIDTIGVLPQIYAIADVVFVGGSLTRRGGQNLLEPAALGRPVLFGPNVDNFRAVADALIAAGGGFVAHDGAELGRLAARFLADPAARRAAGERARGVVAGQRGALARTVERLVPLIGAGASAPRAATGV
jgi:3-deoxy-D-manno-octulosonic-acid transferase